ncbi:MAG: histidinol-phosphate transaminase [Gammaproteobacteria bacterium]|nr:histidinol-phosphate transaminase [Gammaproteobacteria bacterium]
MAKSWNAESLAMPSVARLSPYQPGRLSEAGMIMLASNENPRGPSPAALEAAKQAATTLHRYPDGGASALRALLAEQLSVSEDQLTFGNGSNDVLDLLACVFLGPGRSAVFSEHAFAVYPIATQSAGGNAKVVAAKEYGHDLSAMAAASEDRAVSLMFVANPNNPTGHWLAAEDIEALLESVPSRVIVVVDEAYFEYAENQAAYGSALPLLARYPNLVVTRSFSKFHGLAALRLGYAVSHPQVANLLNRVRHPFNVNAIAQAAGVASLQDVGYLQACVAENADQRERLATRLAALGYVTMPSAANFLCVHMGDAAAANDWLLSQRIAVRPVANYGLPEWLRITIGTPEENEALLLALEHWQ